MGTRSRLWGWIQNALLALASFAVALALLEIGARVFAPEWRPATGERADFWGYHETLGWAHRPDSRSRFRGPSWDVEVRINAQGLRDVEHAYDRGARRRVLLLGDSFAWGHGVRQDRMLTARLAELCPELEFVNAGVSGYGTDQQYLYYREEGRRFEPDEVMLLVSGNDLFDVSCGQRYGYPKPYFERQEDGGLALRNVPVPERSLAQRLYTWLASSSYLGSQLLARTGLAWRLDSGCGGALDLKLNRALLRRFARELAAQGVGFRWVLVPPVIGAQSRTQQFYTRLGRQLGVPVLDLGPAFEEAGASGEPLLLEHDSHWNEAGHAVAAAAVARELGCGDPDAPGS